jgi:hypothetical protein
MPSKRVSLKGKGADLFFGDYTPGNGVVEPPTPSEHALPPASQESDVSLPTAAGDPYPVSPIDVSDDGQPSLPVRPTRRRDSAKPSIRKPAGLQASAQDDGDAEAVEAIRRVVRAPGREVSYVRLSPEEKAQVADIVYAYKKKGRRTTENEISRIALNYLLNDHHEHGDKSVLARVLAKLQA